jgi:hypothetical protein
MKKTIWMLVFILVSAGAYAGLFDRIKSEIKLKEEEKPIFENVTLYVDGETVQEKVLPGEYTLYLFELNYPSDLYGKVEYLKTFSEFLDYTKKNNRKYSILLTKEMYNDFLEIESGNTLKSEIILKEPASSLTYEQTELLKNLSRDIKVREYMDTDQEKLNRQIYILYRILEKKGFIESNVYTELDKENLIEELNEGRKRLVERYKVTPVEYFYKEDYKDIDLKDFSDEIMYKFEKDIALSTKIEDQALFPDIPLTLYITNFDSRVIEELAQKQIKLKRRILLLDNSLYHGYTYNEENTVIFMNGKEPLYYFPDYKINIKLIKTDVKNLKSYETKYNINDFFY